MALNPMDYSAKDTVLDVVRTERAGFYDIVDDPEYWNVQTRCADWEVRDMVGHMIDVTEGYLARWELARKGESADALGLAVMHDRLNQKALAFRELPREAAIARLKTSSDTMMVTFEQLTPEEWSGFMVTHPYMGPVPAFFYPAFHIMDYTVHTWDMRWGLGQKDGTLDERSAGLLVPYMFILMQYTVDAESARGVDAEIGIKVDGEWGGQWRVTVKDGTFSYAPADDLSGVQAVFHFKSPSDFVLNAYQRFPGGEASGDPVVIAQIRKLFFPI
jgi:uncharacterized protein (TIGR03083 family)